MRNRSWLLFFAVFPVCLLGCVKRNSRINVGSKFGTEQAVLGEILAQHLEHRLGTPVSRRLGGGDTDSLHQGLASGEIDLYPEYTGTALRNILKLNMEHDLAIVYERVRDFYAAQYQFACLAPFGFDSAVPPDLAEAHHLSKMSDLAEAGISWKIAYSGSFASRTDGLPALIATYRPAVDSAPLLLDPESLFRALDSRLANLIVVRATDGRLQTLHAVLLPDDRRTFPPYQGFVAVRTETLKAQPQLSAVLGELSGRIDTAAMQRMNGEVELGHKSPGAVARAFLESSGLAR